MWRSTDTCLGKYKYPCKHYIDWNVCPDDNRPCRQPLQLAAVAELRGGAAGQHALSPAGVPGRRLSALPAPPGQDCPAAGGAAGHTAGPARSR